MKVIIGITVVGLVLSVSNSQTLTTWDSFFSGFTQSSVCFSTGELGSGRCINSHYSNCLCRFRGWLKALMVITCITMPLAQPGVLIQIGGVIGIFGFVLYIPVLYVLNYKIVLKKFPNWVVPPWWRAGLLWLVWTVYLAIAIWFIYIIII